MKRMKKKVVAMVTLAMFVMSMLPMAAFAAEKVDVNQSEFKTVEKNVSVGLNDVVPVSLAVKDANGTATNENNGAVYAWLEDENGNVVYDVTYCQDADGLQEVPAANIAVLDNGYAFRATGNGSVLKSLKVSEAGNYTLKAGFLLGDKNSTTNDRKDLTPITVVKDYATIEVASNDVNYVKVTQNGSSVSNKLVDGQSVDLATVEPNGYASAKFTVQAFDASNNKLTNEEFTVKSNSANLVVTGDTVTDNKGEMEFTYKAKANGKFTITLEAVDSDYKVKFVVDMPDNDNKPDAIETVKDGNTVAMKTGVDFSDAVQFKITDEEGDAVVKTSMDNEPIMEDSNKAAECEDYSLIVEQPEKAKLENGDIILTQDKDADAGIYTIKFADSVKNSDLKEGKYVVQMALYNGATAKATFNLAKESDAVELLIKGDDTVKAGDTYKAKLYTVDKNGIETQVEQGTDITVGYNAVNGAAVKSFNTIQSSDENQFGFVAREGEEYYGVKVTLIAIDKENGLRVTKDVTIVDPTVEEKVDFDFDSTNGPVNKDNQVKATLKDENGKTKKVSGDVVAYVAKSSDADANVTVDAGNATDGKATLTVYSDKATTADIVVAVKDSGKAGAVYATTLTYTFGEDAIPADTSVVMTLGSTEMLVNNNIVDMKDAAPFAQNNRTYVPFRALGEALGADVEYDKDAKTVTYTLGGTKIVMTLDSKTYTVNGAKKTMDVAPFAKDNRTYVPVRFVGEGLGFKVTGLQDGNGKYVAVAFTK